VANVRHFDNFSKKRVPLIVPKCLMLSPSKSPAWNSQGRNFINILRDRLFLKLVNADFEISVSKNYYAFIMLR
jgi:hypothetical protein